MPRPSLHILELARRGAAHRYHELKSEMASLVKMFPHLQHGAAVSPAMPDSIEERRTPVRRRRKLSAAARKSVSQRMKKYWAERRSTATDKSKPQGGRRRVPAAARRTAANISEPRGG